ncbi:hypothetical protein JCM8097_006198 [Rhodosporidiobolus ruineniae]
MPPPARPSSSGTFKGWPIRLNTYERRPPPLAYAYSPEIEPHFAKPDDAFLIYTSERATEIRAGHVDDIRQMILQTLLILGRDGASDRFFDLWRGATVAQREQWMLDVFQHTQEYAEAKPILYCRAETPELTLSWAADPTNYDALVNGIFIKMDSGERYRCKSHPSWDRLNLYSTANRSTPPSRGVRAFCEEGKILRTRYLALFWGSITRLVLGIPWKKPISTRASTAFASEGSNGIVAPDSQKERTIIASFDPSCANCSENEAEDGVTLTCCERCKTKTGRKVWYCGVRCQKLHWLVHKPACGRSLDLLEAAPSSNPLQSGRLSTNLLLLEEHPRAVWGGEFCRIGSSVPIPVPFYLPVFVRPYLPALEALKSLRMRVYEKRQSLDIGLLGCFVHFVLELLGARFAGEDEGPTLALLARLLDLEPGEVRRDTQIARERLDADDDFAGEVDPLVVSSLRQMTLGTADLSFPHQNLLESATPLLDGLLRTPSSFYTLRVPPSLAAASPSPSASSSAYPSSIPMTQYVALTVPPDTPSHDRILALLRDWAFRVVLSGGSDRTALGRLVPFAWTYGGMGSEQEGDGPEAYRAHLAAELEEMLGLQDGVVEDSVWQQENRVTAGEDEEEAEVLEVAMRHFQQHGETMFVKMAGLSLEEDDGAGKKAKRRNKKKKKSKKKQPDAVEQETEQGE